MSHELETMGWVWMKLEKVRYEIENKYYAARREPRKAVRRKKKKIKIVVCVFAPYPEPVATLPPIWDLYSGAATTIIS